MPSRPWSSRHLGRVSRMYNPKRQKHFVLGTPRSSRRFRSSWLMRFREHPKQRKVFVLSIARKLKHWSNVWLKNNLRLRRPFRPAQKMPNLKQLKLRKISVPVTPRNSRLSGGVLSKNPHRVPRLWRNSVLVMPKNFKPSKTVWPGTGYRYGNSPRQA